MKVSFQKALDAYAYKKFKVMSELSGKVYEPGRLPDWTLEEVEA